MHVFLLDIPRLEFAAIIPKGDYVTVCLLGEDIDAELMRDFLNAPEVKGCFPPDSPKRAICLSLQGVQDALWRMRPLDVAQPLETHALGSGAVSGVRLYAPNLALFDVDAASANPAALQTRGRRSQLDGGGHQRGGRVERGGRDDRDRESCGRHAGLGTGRPDRSGRIHPTRNPRASRPRP